ncbi:hypothetical protein [Nostoc commune]|uniref:hypothetical protein n=1 Tax=Nostoc commune TaxID=1178 RepID=UPI0018C62EA7|nr:hypothetical protein [Nostoc commune]MBG1263726.1 glycosyltransferase family 4 protein [Nostoc commune BAE]
MTGSHLCVACINQKFWKSIFIRLTPSVEHRGRIRVQQKRCLTAKLCPQNCGRILKLGDICINYDIDIAIALKLFWKHNWLIWKTSAIPNWAKPELIAPIVKQVTCYVYKCNPASKFSILYFDNIGSCHNTATVLQAA